MLKKLNLYTVLTFIIYPVFFVVILILLFLTTCSGSIERFSDKGELIGNEEAQRTEIFNSVY